MKLLLSALLLFVSFCYGMPDAKVLKKEIGRMLIIGFNESKIDENSTIVKYIQKYNLGGVILFDRFYGNRKKIKNIDSKKQLCKLTQSLKSYAKKPLIIAVDEEGGKIARLKPKYGFTRIPSAQEISKMSFVKAKKIYAQMAEMLKTEGINCDFAPVIDLAVNPDNFVIVKLHRSFGKEPKEVVKYAKIMIEELKKKKIISVLKHFPGHGSSLGDSHKGFVDITSTWSKKELEPYEKLIKADMAEAVMTAHVYNSKLDPLYPATLSKKINKALLRDKLGFKGVIISDDLQMKAISKQYSLKQTVTLAINAGVDMLLFANQLANQSIDKIIDTIYKQVLEGAISYKMILEANVRIDTLLSHVDN